MVGVFGAEMAVSFLSSGVGLKVGNSGRSSGGPICVIGDDLDNVELNCRILFIGPCEPILCYCLR